MSKILSLVQSTVVFLMAGLSILNPTRIQAYTTSIELQGQSFEQIPLKLTSSSKDYLIAEIWWQKQVNSTQNKNYDACLFGDSISSGLGNGFGERRFNFAIGGMSSVSLIEQLQTLVAHQVRCQTVIVAIGTNDAWYQISDRQFQQNMTRILALARSLSHSRTLRI